MCEQTEVNYLDGDIVWVKLGPSWWPGEVQDLSKVAPEIVKSFRKLPIAVVKFFEEDKYEYVKNINHIYKYNCRRKHDFIKKGLDMHRAKVAFMDKFPADVCHAESITGGDPDIITNEEFAPEQKPSYSAFFGTPKKPKTIKSKPGHSTPKSAGARLTRTPRITHPRFIGKSDHEVRILEQSTPPAATSHYTCHICGFESSRLNVIVLHNRAHSNGTYVSPSKQKSKKNTSVKKGKRPKSFATTNSIDEDLELIRQGVVISTEESSDSEIDFDIEQPGKKKTPKTAKRKNVKTAVATVTNKKAKVSSICNNLLADWGDDDSSEEILDKSSEPKPNEEKSTEKPNEENKSDDKQTEEKLPSDTQTFKGKKLFESKETDEKEKEEILSDKDTNDKDSCTNEKINNEQSDNVTEDNLLNKSLIISENDVDKKSDSKNKDIASCFDFEEEEATEEVLEKSPGRKIPRVIPPKRISKDSEEAEQTLENQEDKEKETNETKETEEPDTEAFQNILEETAVPDFSSLSDLNPAKKKPDKKLDDTIDKTNGMLKKDTHEAEPVKETEPAITQIPKKRFVRNFEEFESFMNEPKASEDEETDSKSKSTLEVSKLKSQLMSKLNESPTKTPEKETKKPQEEEIKTDEEEVEEKKFFLKKKKISEDRRKKKHTVDIDNIPEKTEESVPEINTFRESVENLEETVLEETKTEIKTDEVEMEPVLVEEKNIEESKNLIEEPAVEAAEEPELPEEDKKEEIIEESTPTEESTQKEDSRSQKMLADISDICIDNADNLSGLSTLAAVSELSGNLYDKIETVVQSPVTETKEETSTLDEITNPPSSVEDTASCLTPVQDEISEPVFQPKPVQTLANFSMDFSDSNSESTIIKTIVADEKIPETIIETSVENTEESKTPKIETPVPTDFETIENEINKITADETTADKINSFPENISQSEPETMEIDTSYPEFSIPETHTTEIVNDKITEITTEQTLESEIAKLTYTQPGGEGVLQEQQQNTSSSKLLEILTDAPHRRVEKIVSEQPTRSIINTGTSQKIQMVASGDTKALAKKFDPKTSKFIIKSTSSKMSGISSKSNKPIILSEKIIKPVTEIDNVSVKKVTSKRTYQDVEDIDTFIIQKPTKKPTPVETEQQELIIAPKPDSFQKYKSSLNRPRGKPKIIEQTIIKAADHPVQATSVSNEAQENPFDDSMFDINSMPIVLSDQILTPESIENMPVVMSNIMPTSSVASTVQTVISDKPHNTTVITKRGGAIQKQQLKIINKDKINTSQSESLQKVSQNVMVKNIIPRGLNKNQKVYQTGSKLLKNNPAVITQPGKPGKFIILPSSTASQTTGSKYTVGKRTAIKSVQQTIASPTTSKQLKTIQQNITGEPTGNKIMIVTNQHGVQSRVLLTPAQQKLLGCKMPTKITKSTALTKGVVQKSILTSKGTLISPSNTGIKTTAGLASQTIVTSKGQLYTTSNQSLVTSEGQVLTPISQQQYKSIKGDQKIMGKKIQMQTQRVLLPDKSGEALKSKMNILSKTKTILIKGSQGQTIKKIQTSAGESKNILLSQAGQKSQLVSIGGQHISGTGKQILVNSKGQIIKTADGKMAIQKPGVEKLQRITSKTSRIVSKGGRQHVVVQKQQLVSPALPPLAPITAAQKKELPMTSKLEQKEQRQLISMKEKKEKLMETIQPQPSTSDQPAPGEQKQPNQLVIQDSMGNQTTVTEGQILGLPSGETVDGQPQSYVLVTVDESGNLVPISNDTLMSLDPNLGAGGDMSNIVLQIDQGAQEGQIQDSKPAETITTSEIPLNDQQMTVTGDQIIETPEQQIQVTEDQLQLAVDNQQLMITDDNMLPASSGAETMVSAEHHEQHPDTFVTNAEETQVIGADGMPLLQDTQQTAIAINNGDSSQQLIITGDPESTQKFLASLSEGNTDLSSLLSGTDGNIIINTDGQQILLNTDSENQILLSVNSDNLGLIQGSADQDASQFVTQQAIKNQDILAAALADTDVFQQETVDKSQALTKVSSSAQSQLSPNSSLYPMNVGNVLETSLTLGSPIMTPLEVPSVNNKKINSDVESSLITQVPSSLELPITITDPSISQTVSQQVMLGSELQTNLELPISISDSGITTIRSSEMNSPNFVYSLPSLDENSDLDQQQKHFTETSTVITSDNIYNTSLTGSMSMPLLTEEPEAPVIEQEQVTVSSHEEISNVSMHEDMPPVSIHEDMPPVSIHEEMPPVSLHEDMPPVSIHEEMPPVSLHEDMPPVSIHEEITPTSIHEDISSASIHEEITSASMHEEMPPVSIHEEITPSTMPPTSIHEEISSADIHEDIPPSSINEEITTDTIQTEIPPTSLHEEMTSTLNQEEISASHDEIPPVSIHEDLPSDLHDKEIPQEESTSEKISHEDIPSLIHEELPNVSSQEDVGSITSQEEISSITSQEEEIPPVSSTDSLPINTECESVTTEPEPNTFTEEKLDEPVQEKMRNELQIGPIDEELDLNSADICSSLSEPPPGMFDKSFSNLLNKVDVTPDDMTSPNETCALNEPINNLPSLTDNTENQEILTNSTVTNPVTTTVNSINESSLEIDYTTSESIDQSEITETQDVRRITLSETPNSDLNSPRLDIDENSAEIPIQPPIITSLSATFDENSGDFNSHEESKKRVNEDEDDTNDVKRSKLSCD